MLNRLDEVSESAAIACRAESGGPNQLVVFVVTSSKGAGVDPTALQDRLNQTLKSDLNPLFRIDQVHLIDALPRTASNKVIRRKLRAALEAGHT